MKTYELWARSDEADWWVLVEESEKNRVIYNDEGFVILDITMEEFISLRESSGNPNFIEFALEIGGKVPEYLFDCDSYTIVTPTEVYENYAMLTIDYPHEDECILNMNREIEMWKPDLNMVKEICSSRKFVAIDNYERRSKMHEYWHAIRTMGDNVLVRVHSIFQHNGKQSLDTGKLMTKQEFEEFCRKEDFDNPFVTEFAVEKELEKFTKGEVKIDTIDWEEKTIAVLLPYSNNAWEYPIEGETSAEIISEFYEQIDMWLEDMIDHIELVREHFKQKKEEE